MNYAINNTLVKYVHFLSMLRMAKIKDKQQVQNHVQYRTKYLDPLHSKLGEHMNEGSNAELTSLVYE